MSEEQQRERRGGLDRINEIIEQFIRPVLQRDGGDLEVLGYEDNVLTIRYQGACGCCPHGGAIGTLNAIQNVLREKYDPNIVVELG